MQKQNETAKTTKPFIIPVFYLNDSSHGRSKDGIKYYRTWTKGVNSLLLEGWELLSSHVTDHSRIHYMKNNVPIEINNERDIMDAAEEITKEEYDKIMDLPF